MIFDHPKWPPAAILCKKKLHIDLKWREMRSKFVFGHPKWGGGGGGWHHNRQAVTIRGYTQYLPLGKYINSSSNLKFVYII